MHSVFPTKFNNRRALTSTELAIANLYIEHDHFKVRSWTFGQFLDAAERIALWGQEVKSKHTRLGKDWIDEAINYIETRIAERREGRLQDPDGHEFFDDDNDFFDSGKFSVNREYGAI